MYAIINLTRKKTNNMDDSVVANTSKLGPSPVFIASKNPDSIVYLYIINLKCLAYIVLSLDYA